MSEWDELFQQVRRSPFNDDPNRVPQEQGSQSGNIAPMGWLEDGSVTADVIRANAVETDKLAANAVTAAKIAANTITANEIAANTITASEIAANTITASEIAAGTITATEIAADSITTSELAANAVITENILAANVTSSRMEVDISGKTFGANDGTAGAPGYYFDSDSDAGLFWVGAFPVFGTIIGIGVGGSAQMLWAGASTIATGDVIPGSDNTYDLGASGNRWGTVYAANGTINTSDRRLKRDIEDAPLGLDFVRSLRPRVFRWADTSDTQAREAVGPIDTSEVEVYAAKIATARARLSDMPANDRRVPRLERIIELSRQRISEIQEAQTTPVREAQQRRRPGRRLHYGLIAQEVKEAIDRAGVDSMDAAFWQRDPDGNEALSYTELMVPLLRAVQELADRVDELESERGGRGGPS